jgi:hypothetical protein
LIIPLVMNEKKENIEKELERKKKDEERKKKG